MIRFASSTFAATFLLTACGGARVSWHLSLVSHVPDQTPVRLTAQADKPAVLGLALDRRQKRPRVITERGDTGDTVSVPEGAKLEARLYDRSHPSLSANHPRSRRGTTWNQPSHPLP